MGRQAAAGGRWEGRERESERERKRERESERGDGAGDGEGWREMRPTCSRSWWRGLATASHGSPPAKMTSTTGFMRMRRYSGMPDSSSFSCSAIWK
jgi:hypothetical protein